MSGRERGCRTSKEKKTKNYADVDDLKTSGQKTDVYWQWENDRRCSSATVGVGRRGHRRGQNQHE